MRIVNLDTDSYLRQKSANTLATAEKEKKDNYLQPCLERRCSFTLKMYSVKGIPVTEALAAKRHISLLLSNNLKWEYSDMCGFIRAQMSLAIVRSNTLLLRGARYKDA